MSADSALGDGKSLTLLTFSSGIKKNTHIAKLFAPQSVKVRYCPWTLIVPRCDAVIGWGRKHTADRARRFAEARKLPYIAIEDGFLRSVGLGVEGARAHSYLLDYSGIYYDATAPSDLEAMIVAADMTPQELTRAEQGMALLCRHRLTKYNQGADELPGYLRDQLQVEERPEKPVLVVDQTLGDASVHYGLADENSFVQMLQAAVQAHPGANIWVKLHPDLMAGKKKGYLLDVARGHNCTLITEDVSPWALLDNVSDVYVVTSQLGFEALLAGKTVHCFGLPFYAGWGLTRDLLCTERRNKSRSLAQVFAAAYLRYCRYLSPESGEPCEFEDTVAAMVKAKPCLQKKRVIS